MNYFSCSCVESNNFRIAIFRRMATERVRNARVQYPKHAVLSQYQINSINQQSTNAWPYFFILFLNRREWFHKIVTLVLAGEYRIAQREWYSNPVINYVFPYTF